MRLGSDRIDGSAGRANAVHDIDRVLNVSAVLDVVVVVQDEDRVRAILPRPFERLHDPVVAAGTRAAERVHVYRARVRRRLVHDVQHGYVGVTGAKLTDPLLDLGALLARRQAADPARLLRTPNQRVALVWDVVQAGVVANAVHPRPVHHVTLPFDGAPLSLVFRRDLVPIANKIRSHLSARRDVPDELAASAASAGGAASPAAGGAAAGRAAPRTSG